MLARCTASGSAKSRTSRYFPLLFPLPSLFPLLPLLISSVFLPSYSYYQALDDLQALGEKHRISMAEIALRWIAHHSQLSRKHGDSVIIGGKTLENIKNTLGTLQRISPLPSPLSPLPSPLSPSPLSPLSPSPLPSPLSSLPSFFLHVIQIGLTKEACQPMSYLKFKRSQTE